MTARIYAYCNQKGGVGKSTAAFHLTRAAVLKGLRVLVVDNDPQGNLTSVLAAQPPNENEVGLADALSATTPETIRDVIVPGIWEGLDVVPTSGESLGSVRDELIIAGAGREARLRDALAPLVDDYDLIFIDNAPSLDQLTINALTAADGVAIVTQSKLWSVNGLAKLLKTIDIVRSYYNPQLQVAGVIVNAHESRTNRGQLWLEELQSAAAARGFEVLQPLIPKRAPIADSAESSKGLDEWGEADDLAQLYTDLLVSLTGATS
jgi:chromosome partitioning protein